MIYSIFTRLLAVAPPLGRTNATGKHSSADPFGDQPRKPDWLVIFMSAVLLLTLLIIWLVDIPALLE